MATATLRHEERLGLIVALAAHAALVVWLTLGLRAPRPAPPLERTEVTLTDEAALTASAPQAAVAPPAAQVAPELGPVEPPVLPRPIPSAAPVPPRPMLVQPSVQPRPTPAKAIERPVPAAIRSVPHTVAAPAKPTARPAAAANKPAPVAPKGSRIGSDFIKGMISAPKAAAAGPPAAAAIGPAVRSSLAGAISRQLKPRWAAPQGVDVDQLVTVLAWDMNADGSLAGAPRVVRQEGIDDANRAQASRHAEQAIRAVRLAAPFNLPSEYYDAWKRVGSFRFDRKLSQ